MNYRQNKKNKRKLLLALLSACVSSLDESGGKYNARALHVPSTEVRTLKQMNGYRIEIRSSREDVHNYAHFHVVKGTDGMASIRIDNLEVIKTSLPNKDLKRVLEWAEVHRNILVEVWNEFHGYRILVE